MFYSTKMEGTAVFKEFLNTQQAVIDNESIRDALTLIDVSPEQPVTRIDLALMCNAKAFLNQPGVAHFLDRLWKRPSENGQYVQWMASYYISPRHKGVINMAGFLSMLMVVMSFISSLPERGDSIELFGALEVTFWVWTLAYVYNELEQFTTLHEYIETVENCIDALIVHVRFGLCSARSSLCRGAELDRRQSLTGGAGGVTLHQSSLLLDALPRSA